jgi:hypothetical protein
LRSDKEDRLGTAPWICGLRLSNKSTRYFFATSNLAPSIPMNPRPLVISILFSFTRTLQSERCVSLIPMRTYTSLADATWRSLCNQTSAN